MEDKDEDGSPVKQIKYVRPSDRSPEKDFHIRNEESKINSCLLRSSVQQARQKLNMLRDELEERCNFHLFTLESEVKLILKSQNGTLLRTDMSPLTNGIWEKNPAEYTYILRLPLLAKIG